MPLSPKPPFLSDIYYIVIIASMCFAGINGQKILNF